MGSPIASLCLITDDETSNGQPFNDWPLKGFGKSAAFCLGRGTTTKSTKLARRFASLHFGSVRI